MCLTALINGDLLCAYMESIEKIEMYQDTQQIIMVTECRSGQNRHQTKWSGCLSFLQKIRCSRFSKLTIMYGPTKIMSLPLFLIPTDNFL